MVTWPEEWAITTVDKLVSISTGRRNKQDSNPLGKYPLYVRSPVVERIDVADYDCEAVLTAGDGDAGKVFHYVNGKFSAHQRVYVMNNFRNVIGRYFYYFFSHYFMSRVKKYTAKSSVDSVRRAMIAEMPIALPPLDEQTAIADTLSTFDTHLANLSLLITKKQAIRDGILSELLSGRTRLEGFSGEWQRVKLGDITNYAKAKQVQPDSIPDGSLIVEMEDIESVTCRLTAKRYDQKPKSAKNRFYPGDVLFGKMRTYLRKIWFADEEGYCSTEIVPFHGNEGVVTKYLMYIMIAPEVVRYTSRMSYGMDMPRFGTESARNLPVNLPPLDEQQAIADTLTALDNDITSLKAEHAKFSALRTAAINDLLTGKTSLPR